MSVIGERTEDYVLNQIKARQKWFAKPIRNKEGRALDDKYNAARTAWLKLASGVELTAGSKFKGGLNYPKKYILFNGTSEATNKWYKDGSMKLRSGIGFEKAYDTSDKEYGIVPMPGIISADIKHLGRGSLKEANVKIKCWSKRQFEILEELYLRLGYNMIMEWGWSDYITVTDKMFLQGSTIIDNDWWNRNGDNTDYRYWLDRIETIRREREGNYDGFFGKVTNFTWVFLPDGSYDIDLKMITHGDVIESLVIPPSTIPQIGNLVLPVSTKINKGEIQAALIGIEDDTPQSVKEGVFAKDTVINRVISNPGSIETGAKKGDDQFVNLSSCTDRLTTHLFNLKFMGRAINNYFTVGGLTGKQARDRAGEADPYGTFVMNPGDITYKNGFKPSYISILAKTGPGGEIDSNDKKVNESIWGIIFGGINWKKELEKKNIELEKYSKSRRNGKIVPPQLSSNTGRDWACLFKNDRDSIQENKHQKVNDKGDKNPKPTINIEGYTYVRLQYLLWYLNEFCVYENTKTKSKSINISWESQIPTYVVPPIECNGNDSLLSISSDPINIILNNNNVTFNTQNFSTFGTINLYSGLEPCIKKSNGVWYIDAQNIYVGTELIGDILNSSSTGRKLNVYSFLKSICEKINGALGNINKLLPVIDTETNTLIIQDNINFPNRNKLFKGLGLVMRPLENGQELQLYGYRRSNGTPVTNFIRNIDLKTTISKEMASMITIGATAKGNVVGLDATGFSKFNVGKINRFNPSYEYKADSTVTNKEETSAQGKLYKAKQEDMAGLFGYDFSAISFISLENVALQNGFYNPPSATDLIDPIPFRGHYNHLRKGYEVREAIEAQVDQIKKSAGKDKKTVANTMFVEGGASKNIKLFSEYFEEAEAARFSETEGGGPSIGFLPFGLNLKMDGLGGYKIYNKLDVDTHFLPYNYPKVTEFIISKVNHFIKDGDWETEIITINVPKSSETKTVKSTAANPVVPKSNPVTETEEGEEVPIVVTSTDDVPCDAPTGAYKYKVRKIDVINDGDVNKWDKFTSTIVRYIEGGYYSPFHSYDKNGNYRKGYEVMYNSGETLWGQDRGAGKLESRGGDGAKFWALVDKYSGWATEWNKIWTATKWNQWFGKPGYHRTATVRNKKTGKKKRYYMARNVNNSEVLSKTKRLDPYKGGYLFDNSKNTTAFKLKYKSNCWSHNFNPLKKKPKNMPQSDLDLLVKYSSGAMKVRYDEYSKAYMSTEFRNFVNSNGRLQFMYFRAVYNGSGFFQKFAKHVEKNYFNKGVRNVSQLICADITNRKRQYPDWHEHKVIKVLMGLAQPPKGFI